MVAVGRVPTKTVHPRPEWSELLPEDLWEAVVAATRQALSAIDSPDRIAALAVASMGEAGIPIDRAGRYLYPAIAWYDPRTEPQRQWWQTNVDYYSIYQITGQPRQRIYSVYKLMWLRDNVPEVYSAMHKWLCIEDFVLWKLSGEVATDYTVASRTSLFDQRSKRWSSTVLAKAGIEPDLLPKAYPSGTQVGVVSEGAARETGLPTGTPVVTGGHDHLCGALAAGVVSPGVALDSTGTAESLVVPIDEFRPDLKLLDGGYTCYCHVVPDVYVVKGGILGSGSLVDWLIEQFWAIDSLRDRTDCADVYDAAFREASSSPLGAKGLFWSPLLMGGGTPLGDPLSKGTLVGITTAHRRGDFLRSLLEALGYWLRENLDHLQGLFGRDVCEQLVTIGGATNSPLWLQIKADITGRDVYATEVRESVALGAALLAGLGTGVWHDASEAVKTVPASTKVYHPEPRNASRYRHLYETIYAPLYSKVATTCQAIHKEFWTEK